MKKLLVQSAAFIALFIFIVGVLFVFAEIDNFFTLAKIASILLITTFAFIGIKFITE